MNRRRFIAGVLGWAAVPAAAAASPQVQKAAGIMKIFDGLLSAGKPNLGLPVMQMIDGLRTPPVGSTGTFMIDYEPALNTVAQCVTAVDTAQPVLESARATSPHAQIGFYALGPVNDFWNYVDPLGTYRGATPDPTGPRDDALAPIANQCDYMLPSLYNPFQPTGLGNDAALFWWKFAVSTCAEARRISTKPLYPYLCPYYLNTNGQVDGQTWMFQLTLLKQIADGVVIWCGNESTWNESDPWWLATQEFL